MAEPRERRRGSVASFATAGESLGWLAGLVLALSAFTGWYSGSTEGLATSVLGWHTGVLGKLVFVIGLAVLVLLALRAAGFELPPAVPVGLVLTLLGALATVFVLVRMITIPDDYVGFGRSIGIWISLAGAILLIVAGLVRRLEEL